MYATQTMGKLSKNHVNNIRNRPHLILLDISVTGFHHKQYTLLKNKSVTGT